MPRHEGPVTASSLLARPDREAVPSAGNGEITVPVALLSDLNDPRLIITADYVGPDRRLLHRREWRSLERERNRYLAWRPGTARPRGRVGGTTAFRVRHMTAAVLLTAITAVPLTLLVSHWAAPTPPGSPASPATHLVPHHPSGTPFGP